MTSNYGNLDCTAIIYSANMHWACARCHCFGSWETKRNQDTGEKCSQQRHWCAKTSQVRINLKNWEEWEWRRPSGCLDSDPGCHLIVTCTASVFLSAQQGYSNTSRGLLCPRNELLHAKCLQCLILHIKGLFYKTLWLSDRIKDGPGFQHLGGQSKA